MDKRLRVKQLWKIYTIISKRRYPARMLKDKLLVLRALERRIFELNGEYCGLRSK